MRRSLLLSMTMAATLLLGGAAQAGDAPGAERLPNLFGPGYDPLRDPPKEAVERGPGIVNATFVAAGDLSVETHAAGDAEAGPKLFGVVLDIQLAAASTTPSLKSSTVGLLSGDAKTTPVTTICLPSAAPPLSVQMNAGVRIGQLNYAIGDRSFYCGGKPARFAATVGEYGLRLSTSETEGWQGPLLLIFEKPAEAAKPSDAEKPEDAAKPADAAEPSVAAKSVSIAGKVVKFDEPKQAGAETPKAASAEEPEAACAEEKQGCSAPLPACDDAKAPGAEPAGACEAPKKN